MVLAPGLGSTSTCWPSFAVRPSAMTRTRASIAPPGLNGTTMRMGLVGQAACARGADDSNGAASADATRLRRPIAFRDIVSFPPCARPERPGLYSGSQPIHRVWAMTQTTDKPQAQIRRLTPADAPLFREIRLEALQQ